MSKTRFPPLPIDAVLPALTTALAGSVSAVLQAPPGAGKTTRVPLALLDQPWARGGKIIMLEPRRLAARAAARRMADLLGEELGETVGYRVRLDSRIGPRTRIEVVTEGLFLRQIQGDPALDGVAAVLFDEFHERSLDGDLALAFSLQAQGLLRDDLRLLMMSATLDAAPVAALLGGAPLITSEGRAYPVDTRWVEPGDRLEAGVARAIAAALDQDEGSILAFLPGTAEIRRTERLLADLRLPTGVIVTPLYGDLSLEQQDAAIRPAPSGQRKVVLATAIAETSLTIDGIRVVVDGGYSRQGRFDPGSGMGRLETLRVSRASADQRRGRAGRQGPGVCYRLWSEPADRALIAFTEPEILRADLAPLALELAAWGVEDAADLPWLNPPPAASLAQARALLGDLGALDAQGRITPHGREMERLGLHPRLAHMVLKGRALGHGVAACHLAALLGERDVLRGGGAGAIRPSVDMAMRLELLNGEEQRRDVDRGTLRAVKEQARQFMRALKIASAPFSASETGVLLALAYPDRVARKRSGGNGQYRLANGRGASLDPSDPVAAAEWITVADLDGKARESRIYLAAALSREDIEAAFADEIVTQDVVAWDAREQVVLARRRRSYKALPLKDEALLKPPAEAVAAALTEGIAQIGLGCLPWSNEALALRHRVTFLRRSLGDAWPDWSDAGLLATLDQWLTPHLGGLSRIAHLSRLDMTGILAGALDWSVRQDLDRLAPTHVQVPSGSRLPIQYEGDIPTLAVRLQELFGLARTPQAGGVPLLLHLLSPAHRPIQVTRDLASFWANTYREVKKDLAGRYPRHYWPDDPLQAEPTARAKRRGT